MRTVKAIKNIFSSLGMQIIILICGFILPKAILRVFGSEINGLIASVTRFLSYITMLDAGIGIGTMSALYEPISKNDIVKVSSIVRTTEIFFRNISKIFLVYVIFLSILYPKLVNNSFSYIFTFSLILIISISIFVQYYFGTSYSLFLDARQEGYISNYLQCATIVLNTILSCLLIKLGFGIHIVRLSTTLVYIIRPIFLFRYVRRKRLIVKASPDKRFIGQRWDVFGHHIAYFIHQNTDVAVITLLLNLTQVSVYSVYYLVVTGIRNLALTVTNGMHSGIGDIIARKENNTLLNVLQEYETLISIVSISLFTTTLKLFVPFILIYTSGITDVSYERYDIAFFMVISEFIYCIRSPYIAIISSAGNFRQTRTASFIEAGINIILSILLVKFLNIAGILIATIVSLLYRMFYSIIYLKINILYRRINISIKRLFISLFIFFICYVIDFFIPTDFIKTYAIFFTMGLLIFICNFWVTLLLSFVFYNKSVKAIFKRIMFIINR